MEASTLILIHGWEGGDQWVMGSQEGPLSRSLESTDASWNGAYESVHQSAFYSSMNDIITLNIQMASTHKDAKRMKLW